MSTHEGIGRLRTALGFKLEEVALMAGWSVARQRDIEGGADVAAQEADVLSALLGADIEAILDGRASPENRPLGALLKSQALRLDARTRFAVAEATTVAREAMDLRRLLGLPMGLGPVGAFAADGDTSHPRYGTPERLATAVRCHLSLGNGPIASVARDVLDPLGIEVFWTDLPSGVDALAFASQETGAVVLANPRGQHMRTPFGRRVAFTHEVCHLLFDRPEMLRFTQACRIERGLVGSHRGWFEDIERRARAFSLHLLAPSPGFVARWKASQGLGTAERVRDLMEHFGIGYSATRSHLDNVHCMPLRGDLEGVETALGGGWETADPLPGPGHPRLRTQALQALVASATTAGRISPRLAEDLLRGPLRPPEAWSPRQGTGRGLVTTSMGNAGLEAP